MSELAQKIAVTPIAEGVRNRILILDVERLDGITQQHWWDRGDIQKRYIHHETVIREPRTTIVCAQWYDQADTIRLAEWDKGGRGTFLKRVHRLLAEADIVVGHNIDRADIPWLKGDFYLPKIGHPHRPNLRRLPMPKTVDTLKIMRTEFGSGAPFKSLDALCQILGLPSKVDSYDRDRMERAVAGSREDQERLVDYCAGDINASRWLYDWARPHIKNHPALFLEGQDKFTTCRSCAGKLKPIARRWVADVFSYPMLQCERCGWCCRQSFEPERMAIVRGV